MAASARNGIPPLPNLRFTLSFAGLRIPHRALGIENALAYHDVRVSAHLRRNPTAYDVVHCWPGAALITCNAAAKLGIPALREVPNTHTENAYRVVEQVYQALDLTVPVGNSHRRNPVRLKREKAEYEAAFRLLVPSDYVANTFRARGFSEEKLLRHQYGFDPAVFMPASERRSGPLRAVFLGSGGPRKGLHVALKAWSCSQASKEGGRFSVIGRIEEEYRKIINDLKVPGVEIHDFTSEAQGALQSSDVLLLPSFEEGSALVTYEAQGCGVIPLVSEAAGAMCAHGVTGLVHFPGDAVTLAAHLDSLSTDTGLLRTMRQAILDQRGKLTWAAAAERLEACYESALKEARSRHAPSRSLVPLCVDANS